MIGGFISAAHDIYVETKCQHFRSEFMPATVRNDLVKLTVRDTPWLEAGLWQSSPARKSWKDYRCAVRSLGNEVYARFGAANIVIFYVCGKDHFEKSIPAIYQMTTDSYSVEVVAVGRGNQMPSDPGLKVRQKNNIHLISPSSQWANVSSTRIRNMIRDQNWTECGDIHPGVK